MKMARFVPVFVMATLLLGGSRGAFAQEAPQPAPQAQSAQMEQARERLQQVKDRLQLTPEQAEQVRPVFLDELQQLKALRDKHADDGDQGRRGKLKMARDMRDVQKQTDEKLQKILTKTQMEEMKKIREEWRQQLRVRLAGSTR